MRETTDVWKYESLWYKEIYQLIRLEETSLYQSCDAEMLNDNFKDSDGIREPAFLLLPHQMSTEEFTELLQGSCGGGSCAQEGSTVAFQDMGLCVCVYACVSTCVNLRMHMW